MARPRRYLAAGAHYHVTTRGNNKAPIALDDGDRAVFAHILRRVERRYGWRTHVRCLMGNHFHLVVETPAPNLSDGMRDLNGGYARAFNERHSRRDHVFGRRFWAKLIESEEQYTATVEYVLNNPLHHGFALGSDEWRWMSAPSSVR
jgi:REP element-mobilizing transposase RayT